MGFPGGSNIKESTFNEGDVGREDPLEKGTASHSGILSGLEISRDREAWQATVQVFTKSWT